MEGTPRKEIANDPTQRVLDVTSQPSLWVPFRAMRERSAMPFVSVLRWVRVKEVKLA